MKSSLKISEVCLLAGKIMLESGAETYRVEDTMVRIAASFGAENAESYVTPTGIIFSLQGGESPKTNIIRVVKRTTDLNKIAAVNHLSREISAGKWTVEQALVELKRIEKEPLLYSPALQIFVSALASACFLIMFRGQWGDFFPAFFTGGIGYFWFLTVDRLAKVRFFSEFSASVVIALAAAFFVRIGWGAETDKIIIGSVMPLVPGLLITNAIRDLMAGHLVAGIARGAEAFLTAFAIGSGVAMAQMFL